jgi:hypothetical protein
MGAKMWEACGLGGGMGRGGGRGVSGGDCALEVVMRVLVFKLIAVEVRDARSSGKDLRGFVLLCGARRT